VTLTAELFNPNVEPVVPSISSSHADQIGAPLTRDAAQVSGPAQMLGRLMQHDPKRFLGPGPSVLLVKNINRDNLKRRVAFAIAPLNAPRDDRPQHRYKMICLHRRRGELIVVSGKAILSDRSKGPS
jgi:hypothetical protein